MEKEEGFWNLLKYFRSPTTVEGSSVYFLLHSVTQLGILIVIGDCLNYLHLPLDLMLFTLYLLDGCDNETPCRYNYHRRLSLIRLRMYDPNDVVNVMLPMID